MILQTMIQFVIVVLIIEYFQYAVEHIFNDNNLC